MAATSLSSHTTVKVVNEREVVSTCTRNIGACPACGVSTSCAQVVLIPRPASAPGACCRICRPRMIRLTPADYRPGQILSTRRKYRLHMKIDEHTHIRNMDTICLENLLGKYVCSMLNTIEGGIVDLGVQDSETVTGFWCPMRTRNAVRSALDKVFGQHIAPRVLRHAYTVRFIPVRINPTWTTGFRVMEIEIWPTELRGSFPYLFKGVCYIAHRTWGIPVPYEWTSTSDALTFCVQTNQTVSQQEPENTTRLEQNLDELRRCVSQLSEKLDCYVHQNKSQNQ